MKKQINVEYLHSPRLMEDFVRWNLDAPKQSKKFKSDTKVAIKGWAIAKGGLPVELLVEDEGIVQSYEFDQVRPDVISKVLKGDVADHCEVKFGFRIDIFLNKEVKIGFRLNSANYWVARIVPGKIYGAFVGGNGYIFLDNDTNRSKEQFLGKFLIDEQDLKGWKTYFSKLDERMSHSTVDWAFVLAPSREYIFPELYPFKRGKTTSLDQFFYEIAPWQHRIIYPVETLVAKKASAFSKIDTHWTDYGALEVAKDILRYFGLRSDFALPKFSLRWTEGDLGRKLEPKHTAPIFWADFSKSSIVVRFDNKIKNAGRIIHYENELAPEPEILMIFGGSSSSNLIPWLCLIYQNVVFVHSTGSVDITLLDAVRPTKVILQTNARFLVRASVVGSDTASAIEKKIASFLPDVRARWNALQVAQPESVLKRWHIERSLIKDVSNCG